MGLILIFIYFWKAKVKEEHMQRTVAQDLDYFVISSQVLSYKNFNKLQSYFLHCM